MSEEQFQAWKQATFDVVYRHFILERNPRSTEGNRCQYRSANGGKCAYGLFIPDALYALSMEGKRVHELARLYPALGLSSKQVDWFQRLQGIHDSCVTLELMKKDLLLVAHEEGLIVPS